MVIAKTDEYGTSGRDRGTLLATHRDVQAALREEVDRTIGDRQPTTADLANVPLARAEFEETMRLYPAAWAIPREAIAEDHVMGYRIAPGSIIILGQYWPHRHPRFWDSAERFRPERFLGEAPPDRPRFAYFPFGGGPRACVGAHFAMIEAQLVVIMLAQRFEWQPSDDGEIELDPTFTLRPSPGVHLKIRRR